jgi:hypothetical protein
MAMSHVLFPQEHDVYHMEESVQVETAVEETHELNPGFCVEHPAPVNPPGQAAQAPTISIWHLPSPEAQSQTV